MIKLVLSLIILISFTSCSAYQSTVASRKVGFAGTYDKTSGVGGQFSDEVTYR